MNHDSLRQRLHCRHPQHGEDDRRRRRLGQRRAAKLLRAEILLAQGLYVFPINPGHAGKEILGRMVYAQLADMPEPIDMVDIFRASTPRRASSTRRWRSSRCPKVIWMQLGVRNDEAAARPKQPASRW